MDAQANWILKYKVTGLIPFDASQILQHIPFGVCIIDGQGNMASSMNAEFIKMFNLGSAAASSNIYDVLEANKSLPTDDIHVLKNVVDASVGEDLIFGYLANQHVFPKSFSVNQKILELTWTPILNESNVVLGFILTVRDDTDFQKLKSEAETSKREINFMVEILSIPAARFEQFIIDCKKQMELGIKRSDFLPLGGNSRDDLMRILHQAKGNARTLGLKALTENIHFSEQLVIDFAVPKDVTVMEMFRVGDISALNSNEEYTKTHLALDDLRKSLRDGIGLLLEYQEIHRDKLRRSGENEKRQNKKLDELSSQIKKKAKAEEQWNWYLDLLRIRYPSFEQSLYSVKQSLNKMSFEIGIRTPNFVVESFDEIQVKDSFIEPLRSMFAQLTSNSLIHSQLDKESSEIKVDVFHRDEEIIIIYRDSGRGLNLNKIFQTAKKTGIFLEDIKEISQVSDEAIAESIFHRGLTTAERVSKFAGRGAGMDVVRGVLEKHKGHIEIQFTAPKNSDGFRPFQFMIRVPQNEWLVISALKFPAELTLNPSEKLPIAG